MNIDFFRSKRPWSKYKDAILDYYLEPYIPKVARLNRSVLIVDCFAGRGRFEDGEPGSPVIICNAIQRWREKGKAVSGEFIEADRGNFETLKNVLASYRDFATVRSGKFEDQIDELAMRAKRETVFLYVDPYTVKGLVFDRMKAVYDQIHKAGSSVEVLMNFNVATFMRWALAALKRFDDLPVDAVNEDADYQADDPEERLEIATLSEIAGGDYWQSIATDQALTFPKKLATFTEHYARRLRASFNFVCTYPVKSKFEHQVPKYMLVYATRHPDGLELMNDAMCDARMKFLGSQFRSGRLFDMTPSTEMPDLEELKTVIIQLTQEADQLNRKDVRTSVLSSYFCRYMNKDINKAVGDLLKSGKLFSATGKSRIDDTVLLSTRAFFK